MATAGALISGFATVEALYRGHWYKEVCWHTLISCEEPYFLAITRRNRTGNGLILIIAVLLRRQAIQFAENSALA